MENRLVVQEGSGRPVKQQLLNSAINPTSAFQPQLAPEEALLDWDPPLYISRPAIRRSPRALLEWALRAKKNAESIQHSPAEIQSCEILVECDLPRFNK